MRPALGSLSASRAGLPSAGRAHRLPCHGKGDGGQDRGADRSAGADEQRRQTVVCRDPGSPLFGEGDESDDSDNVEDQDGDAVDPEAGMLLGRSEQEAGHVDDGKQAAEAGEVDVGGVGGG